MCRLLAYGCKAPLAVENVVGRDAFSGFRQLSRLHRDGWGMAWLAAPDDEGAPGGYELSGSAAGSTQGDSVSGRLRARRSVLPAYEDPTFSDLAGRRLGTAGFVHLRWATSGLAVTENNTHPFLSHQLAFGHQGSIPTPERIALLLEPDLLAARQGTTDSELYFLYLLQSLEREGDLIAGIRRAVNDIGAACGAASLNAVLLSSSSLVAVHGRAGLDAPREDLLAAVGRPEDLPLDHLEWYFRLQYRPLDEGIVITSSGVAGNGWLDVPDDSILHFDIDTRSLSFHSFDGASDGAAT